MKNAIIVLAVAVLLAGGAVTWTLTRVNDGSTSLEELMQENETLKQEMEDLKGEDVIIDESEKDGDEKTDEDVEKDPKDEEKVKDSDSKAYSGVSYITIDSPKNEAYIYEAPVSFKGVVSPNTTKISVHASGGEPIGPGVNEIEDQYTLNDFDKGDTSFVYRASEAWNNLAHGTNDYEFTAYFDDGTKKTASISIFYTPGGAEMGKPVIYLYPEKDMDVQVNVSPNGGFSLTEPAIASDGWKVFAQTDGTLYNYADGITYPYLFWEGFAQSYKTPEEGFVVSARQVPRFFDDKLSFLGLNRQEIKDFKEFWVPRMQDKAYYFITFVDQESFDQYAPLEVSPSPDSVIRVIFDHQGLDSPIEVKEQSLEKAVREGFAVVEWGGRL